MTTVQLRAELIRMAEREGNNDLLALASRLLNGRAEDDVLRAKLTARAMHSNDDIVAGRTHSKEEVLRRMNEFLRGR